MTLRGSTSLAVPFLPTCPGINPTLTLGAMVCRAADRLVERIVKGEQP